MTAKDFSFYVGDFYAGDRGIYKDFFNNELTQKTIHSFMPDFIRFRGERFDGDSFDREILRDIMLVMLGYEEDIMEAEYCGCVEEWFYGSHIWAKWKLENRKEVK